MHSLGARPAVFSEQSGEHRGSERSQDSARAAVNKGVEGALAKLRLAQLASVTRADEVGQRQWAVEFPVSGPDGLEPVTLLIERESPGAWERDEDPEGPPTDPPAAPESAWSVQLRIELDHLGPLLVRLRVQGERVSAWLHVEQPEAERLISAELGELERRLSAKGFVVAGLDCARVAGEELVVGTADPLSPSDAAGPLVKVMA